MQANLFKNLLQPCVFDALNLHYPVDKSKTPDIFRQFTLLVIP